MAETFVNIAVIFLLLLRTLGSLCQRFIL